MSRLCLDIMAVIQNLNGEYEWDFLLPEPHWTPLVSPTPVPQLLSIHISSHPVIPLYYNVKTYQHHSKNKLHNKYLNHYSVKKLHLKHRNHYSVKKLHLKHLNHYSVKKLELKHLNHYILKKLHIKQYSYILCAVEKYSGIKIHSSPCSLT